MATKTIVINICDRCGSQHPASDYSNGNSWAQMNLSWLGDKGGRSYDGAAGGIELKGKAWLCEPCTNAFLDFIKPRRQVPA